MKKVVVVVLLLAALGTTLYLITRGNEVPGKEITRTTEAELLIGKWKLDHIISSKDSTNRFMAGILGIVATEQTKYRYEFTPQGAVVLSLEDSLPADSCQYEWNNKNQLVWKEHAADTTADVFTVSTLNKDSLVLQAADSTSLVFTKAKE